VAGVLDDGTVSLPLFTSLRGYRRASFRVDLTAGLLIVAIAIPLSMGMAEVAGMPPIAGLYACVLPLVAYAALGSSRQLVIALDASTAMIVAVAVAPLAGGDPVRYAALVGGLTILAGSILLLAGTVRMGLLADFLSEPVLLGYQAGLAIVVIASQVPRMLGVTTDATTTVGRYRESLLALDRVNAWSIVIAVGAFMTMLVLRRWKRVPGALIAIAGATAIVAVLDLAAEGVAVLGPLPSGIPPLGLPDIGLGDLRDLVPGAAAIALVAAADTLVSSRAFAARNGYEVDANRDLIGLGAANISAGVSGGITVSASAARTAVAESVGSRTQLAGLTAAATMTLVLVFATGFLRDVPVPALAAVVTAAVLRLFEPAAMRTLWHVRRTEFAIAIAAMAGVALIGVLEGVVIAMALSLFDFLQRTSHPHDAVLGVVPDRPGFHDMLRVPGTGAIDGALVFRFDAPLFYANAQRFRSRVRSLTRRLDDLRLVVLEASTIPDIDVTAARMLGELRQELGARGVRLVVADAVGSVGDLLVDDELGTGFDRHDLFDTLEEALQAGERPETIAARSASG
jgi:SulP family sulfate permease